MNKLLLVSTLLALMFGCSGSEISTLQDPDAGTNGNGGEGGTAGDMDGGGGSGDDGGGGGDDASTTTDPDAGPTATPLDPNAPTVCTSKTMWTRGDHGSSSMHPGGACVSCHQANGGPTISIGGTVYPSVHEPDDCNGAAGAQVIITDHAGHVTTLTTNSAGNFYSAGALSPPFHAKVVANGKERVMVAEQTSGDCNSCHTVTGTMSAPGRITLP